MTAKERIKHLQRAIGVTPDGVIGKQTLIAFSHKFNKTAWQTAQFFANVHHETAGFTIAEENLNYTKAERIRAVWPSRFPTVADAIPFVRNPRALANKVYNGRMGNVITANDGWTFRGRGALQLTGRANYQAFAEYIGDHDVMTNPDLVANDYFWASALFFFDKDNVWSMTTTEAVRKRVNGGLIGIKDVEKLVNFYYI